MTNKRILKEIAISARKLEYGMSEDKIRNRTHMVFKHIFGDDCIYIKQLYDIRFEPKMYRNDDREFYTDHLKGIFESGKQELIDLIELAIEEYELFIAPDAKQNESIGIVLETVGAMQSNYILEQVEKCDEKLAKGDYDGAITNARTLVETIMLEIINGKSQNYDYNGDLLKLNKELRTMLNMEVAKDYPESILQIISGLTTIVNGVANVRNVMSDAHVKRYKPSKHHAKLAVNSAKTITEFYIDSYRYQVKQE